MAVGRSGRIVIEIDPDLKRDIYAALARDGVPLKQWFLHQAEQLLRHQQQLSLALQAPDGDNDHRPRP